MQRINLSLAFNEQPSKWSYTYRDATGALFAVTLYGTQQECSQHAIRMGLRQDGELISETPVEQPVLEVDNAEGSIPGTVETRTPVEFAEEMGVDPLRADTGGLFTEGELRERVRLGGIPVTVLLQATERSGGYAIDEKLARLAARRNGTDVAEAVVEEAEYPLEELVLPADHLGPESIIKPGCEPTPAAIISSFAREQMNLIATRDGSYNRCKRTSTALQRRLSAAGIDSDLVKFSGYRGDVSSTCHEMWRDKPTADWTHYAVVVGPVVYDLTARQFDESADYPVVSFLDTYARNWMEHANDAGRLGAPVTEYEPTIEEAE